MSIRLPFNPCQGTEDKIKAFHPTARDGWVYFATDTKKIYCGKNGEYIPMGGNSGIYYGEMIEPEGVDSDVTIFDFKESEITGNQIPSIDDLILNIPNGCFYRVIRIEYDINEKAIITAERLTISGGSSGSSPGRNIMRLYDSDNNFQKYYSTDASNMIFKFTVTSNMSEEVKISTLNIKYTTKTNSYLLKTYTNQAYGTEFIVDLKPYFTNPSKYPFSIVDINHIEIEVIDEYDFKKTFTDYEIYFLEMSLETPIKDSILLFNQNIYQYRCTPNASKSLTDIKLHLDFYNMSGQKLEFKEIQLTSQSLGDLNTFPLNFIQETDEYYINLLDGTYLLKVYLSGKYTSSQGEILTQDSNVIEYQIIRHSSIEQDILGVYFNKNTIEEYTTVSIPCMVASNSNKANLLFIYENVDSKESVTTEYTISTNTVQFIDWYCNKKGTYNLTIQYGTSQSFKFYNIKVIQYSGDIPIVNTTNLLLNLSATNRSNNQSNKDEWIGGTGLDADGNLVIYSALFTNFYWGDINGWLKDPNTNNSYLHLSSGAKMEIQNFYPFSKDIFSLSDNSIAGMTIEIDFKLSGVLDYQKPLITCLSKSPEGEIVAGFQLTGGEGTFNTNDIKATNSEIVEGENDQIFNTAIQGLTARYVEGERIKLTWVIEKNTSETVKRPKIITYINGVISGFTQYGLDDHLIEDIKYPAIFQIDSTYADIDIYNIRFYNAALSATAVLKNHIATLETNDEKIESDKQNSILTSGAVDLALVASENYNLKIPYIKLTGGVGITKGWEINSKVKDINLPVTKKDFRLMDFEYFDPNEPKNNQKFTTKINYDENGDISLDSDGYVISGCKVYGQGTSSMEYPVKNLRIEFRENSTSKKVSLLDNLPPVKRFCLKADYMESSGSHNTGTATLMDYLLQGLGLKTPGQNFYDNLEDYKYDTVTAIKGFPVIIFWSPGGTSLKDYTYIGKYNFNLDKSTQEPFGFIPYPKKKEDVKNSPVSIGWDTSDINNPKDIVRCFEFLNNASDLANFRNSKTKIKDNDGNWILGKNPDTQIDGPISLDAADIEYAEGKYPLCDENGYETFYHCFFKKKNISKEGEAVDIVNEEGDKVYNWQNSLEARYPDPDPRNEDEGAYIDREYAIQFFEVCNWVNSTENDLNKFKTEFTQYFNHDFVSFYYVMTHFLLMIDSRAKNLMLASWGPEVGLGSKHIWYPIFYDMDTMLGLNNYGYNKFSYDLLDYKEGLYNGQNSILWKNYREAFPDKIRQCYNNLRTKGGLNYDKLIETYNTNQADKWNETLCNEDAEYKYERPFNSGFSSSLDGENSFWVEAGKKDYFYAAQGRRSMHRKNWLTNRFPFMDGYYLSSGIKGDKFILRLYTPQSSTSGNQYFKIFIGSQEEFQEALNKYGALYEIIDGEYIEITGGYNENSSKDLYYKPSTDSEESEKLDNSLIAVPPNSDFKLTSFKNAYLSVAYGGDNGETAGPIQAKANTETRIPAPSGGVYNDTETYLYGGSELQSLGDLSPQYLGRFDFPDKESKLKELILGNYHNNYYNPNFSQLNIGPNAPYLETLNIMNCIGLSRRSLSVTHCLRLKKILATGSGLTNLTLADHGVIEELRLPDSIMSLKLINQPQLQNDKFTVGTCNYNPDTQTSIYTNNFTKLNRVTIENTPGINSYNVIKNSSNLRFFYLPDINWTIENKEDLSFDKDGFLTGIILLDKLSDPTLYQSDKDGVPLNKAIQGMVKISVINDSYGNPLEDDQKIKVNAIDIYNKYAAKFPNIKFIYENLHEDSSPTYSVTFLNDLGEKVWEKEISRNSIISQEFLNTSPLYGPLKEPVKMSSLTHNYIFKGWSINDSDEVLPTNNLIGMIVETNLICKPIFSEEIIEYTIIYYNYDGSEVIDTKVFKAISTPEYPEGGKVPDCSIMPYRNSENLETEKCYIFQQYIDKISGQKLGKDVSTWTPTRNYEVYPEFKIGSVYDNVLDEKYYIIESQVLKLKPKQDVILKGKITLPFNTSIKYFSSYYPTGNGLSGQDEITHIFWQKPNKGNVLSQEFKFYSNCAYNRQGLKYMGVPQVSRIIIEPSAFNSCMSLFSNIEDELIEEFFDRVVYVGENAFGNVKGLEGKNIYFKSIELILSRAFKSTKLANAYIKGYIVDDPRIAKDAFDEETTISPLPPPTIV